MQLIKCRLLNNHPLKSEGLLEVKETEIYFASFEAFTATMFEVEVFWVVTPCNVVVGYQLSRDPCCLHLMGCDAVYCCGRISTFQISMLPPSSG